MDQVLKGCFFTVLKIAEATLLSLKIGFAIILRNIYHDREGVWFRELKRPLENNNNNNKNQ